MATVVPGFEALRRVQDKVSAARTLDALGIARPRFSVLGSATEISGWDAYPAYVKAPIGTASTSVRRVGDAADLSLAVATPALAASMRSGAGVLVEEAVPGSLLMVQAVFDHGCLVAFHANRRVGEGAGGGGSHKESVHVPEVRADITKLGTSLDWHGALSADVILSPAGGHHVIDVNPRLVEPGNAWRSGLDLVRALLDVAVGGAPSPRADGIAGVRTHQVLLAVLGAAEQAGRRRAVWTEAADAALHRGLYEDSAEELTPLAGDPRAGIPPAVALLLTSISPRLGRYLASSSTGAYAITARGWQRLLDT